MICDVCGCDESPVESVNDTFRVEDHVFVVENIPAEACARCGEAMFAADVAEKVRRLIYGPHQPILVLRAEVLSYPAA